MGIDVSAARAKFERAAEHHLTAYEAELMRLEQNDAHTTRVGEINKDTGWCEVFQRWHIITDFSLATIAGDLVHNLRSSLDYLVAAMVDLTGTPLTKDHQFPICTTGRKFREAIRRGSLDGVTVGRDVVERYQPFNTHPTSVNRSSLAYLQRFSNTDKHRQLLDIVLMPKEGGTVRMEFEGGTLAELWQTDDFRVTFDEEVKILALRFTRPYPPEVIVEPDFPVWPVVVVPPLLPDYPKGAGLSLKAVKGIIDNVARVIDEVDQL